MLEISRKRSWDTLHSFQMLWITNSCAWPYKLLRCESRSCMPTLHFIKIKPSHCMHPPDHVFLKETPWRSSPQKASVELSLSVLHAPWNGCRTSFRSILSPSRINQRSRGLVLCRDASQNCKSRGHASISRKSGLTKITQIDESIWNIVPRWRWPKTKFGAVTLKMGS